MNNPKNVAEAIAIAMEKVASQNPPKQATRMINEFMTAYYRFVLPGLGWKRANYKAKLTAQEKQDANAFATTVAIKVLPKLLETIEKGFDLVEAPESSRATYGARMRSTCALIESEPWYPGNAILNRRLADECRPPIRRGWGDHKTLVLMEEKGKQLKYRMKDSDKGPLLRAQLKEFHPSIHV